MKPAMLGCDGAGRLVFSGLTTIVTSNTTKIITAPYNCTLPIAIGHSHSKHFISRRPREWDGGLELWLALHQNPKATTMVIGLCMGGAILDNFSSNSHPSDF
eukprot:311283_1